MTLQWLLALALGLAGLVVPAPSEAAQRAFAQRFVANANGDIVFAANASVTCGSPTAASCSNVQQAAYSATGVTNNQYSTAAVGPPVNVNIDPVAGNYNSSSAGLTIPPGGGVLWAGLYWAGSSSAAARGSVRLKTPGAAAYQTVTATVTDDDGGGAPTEYQSFRDVTAIVSAAGAGTYTVANITTTFAANNFYAAWTLVVVRRDPAAPTRNLAVYDGYQRLAGAGSVDIALTGFNTPPFGTVTSSLGVVGYDGDRGSTEGAAGLQFGTSTAGLSPVSNGVNPQTDVFNSTISNNGALNTARNPAYQNTLGFDADIFTPNTQLPNGASTAAVRVSSSNETIDVGVITLATNIFVPNIKDTLIKSGRDVNGGVLVPGDVIEYTIAFANTGNDPAIRAVLRDAIPVNTTYVANSLRVTGAPPGVTLGARTDATADDSAEFSGNTVTFRVGRTPTATIGGTLNPGDAQTVTFQVTVNAAVPGDTRITNSAVISYTAQTLLTPQTDTSDSDTVTPGDQPATIVVASPDLAVSKTHTPAGFYLQQGGPNTPTFNIVVTNNGPAPTFGTVTLADLLPAALSPLAISGTGWTCTLATTTCVRTDVLASGASYPTILLTVTPNATGTVTNTATAACACEGASQTGNNSATDTVSISPSVNLSITKTNGTDTLVAGSTTSYTLTIANTGPSDAAGSVVSDPAVAGLVCTAVTCTAIVGPPTATCPATVDVAGLQAGLAIPAFPANSSLRFVLTCGVTATGLP